MRMDRRTRYYMRSGFSFFAFLFIVLLSTHMLYRVAAETGTVRMPAMLHATHKPKK